MHRRSLSKFLFMSHRVDSIYDIYVYITWYLDDMAKHVFASVWRAGMCLHCTMNEMVACMRKNDKTFVVSICIYIIYIQLSTGQRTATWRNGYEIDAIVIIIYRWPLANLICRWKAKMVMFIMCKSSISIPTCTVYASRLLCSFLLFWGQKLFSKAGQSNLMAFRKVEKTLANNFVGCCFSLGCCCCCSSWCIIYH